ncbi:phosphoribosyl-AMP cyclohydrolase [Candidatus Daviesbacteria bacterium RIFCSPLOWO2_02_FULL_41_8]|uniref:Histidine biosynthesis bifunctional protein HisIE n=3 Tax=Candidatus Daviesiibacteriota TaxID=1752718 RepID=A0A1F5NLK1_9BACT|nr:MAG: phosphoribosyl-AMP cyclohydrolase [Candidatus Daviesbacteria bacterium RIFCSPHIGHO2_01_FULL_41_23]OGE32877.1 MAG: phosphoribosyl-AMP cyclohydrolase [Candidatus Daviesbacteria bacterium RIFCSPHIGHO2_02_FULL_41_10]OGE62377.1 MAG: phosphoribosyl-AMP cyclohydrolase [Candidatus Daviesbacteria bacterium RIFCSPLOWO2_01_FULL_41_32]OGE78549.1 MAG: phosphoribosyl-AMP cyclohydrolase [Candidatus Daviesbacteria bacterium RIFCSPLOWO2_02_FULL_41_8]
MKNIVINFKKDKGLVPAIIQDYKSGEVLMLGFMNSEALKKTLESRWVYFWSRSRSKLWMKGVKSGNKLKVKKILMDCDADTILIKAELAGTSVCHTGSKTCFKEVI